MKTHPSLPSPQPIGETMQERLLRDAFQQHADVPTDVDQAWMQIAQRMPELHTQAGQVRFPFWLSRKQPRKARRMSDQQLNQPAYRKASKMSPGGLLRTPVVKVALGLLVGIGLLLLVSRFVDVPTVLALLHKNLTTPRGIMLALLSGVAFLLAWSIRGIRWKLFVNPIGKMSILKAIQLYQVGVFLNFLLPVRGGEVVKCFLLKQSTGIAVSKSLSTVAMDKALDLMPALFIMALVPLLGIQMDIKLWVVLAFVSGILISLLCFVVLAAWKRDAAIGLLQKLTGLLPQAIAGKIEGFATGFVDALLMGARQPRIFLPAILLTGVAVLFDGLFAMLAFWTIGFPISFGTAIFGYTVYNMFYILPTPPGQVGSNEAVGLLVFAGLLHLPANQVTAMFFFSHPWAALLMCATGLAGLSALGLTLTGVIRVRTDEDAKPKYVPWSIAGKPVSQVWTKLSALSLYIGTQQSAWYPDEDDANDEGTRLSEEQEAITLRK